MERTYRKKPIVVEAVQWTGENYAEMCKFIYPGALEIIPQIGLVIHTLEGDHHASPGDYIIKGVNGEFFPCKLDIFTKTYESSTSTPQNEWVSVDERLPEPGERVLAADGSFVGEVYMASNGTWFRHDGFLLKIDHWMPLPEPPKEE